MSHPLGSAIPPPAVRRRPASGRLAVTVLAACLVGALVSGCGSDDGGDAKADAPSSSGSAATAAVGGASGGGPASGSSGSGDSGDEAKAAPNEAWPRFEVGQCVQDIGRRGFRTVSCDGAHEGEVVIVDTMPDTLRPNSIDFNGYPREKCIESFAPRLARQSDPSALILQTLAPSVATWQTADRRMTCIAVRKDDAPLTAALAA